MMIYFDNAASAKPFPEAVQAAQDCALSTYANPSSLHSGGIEAERIITGARELILSKLPSNGNLYFTSGGTESNNLAILGACKRPGKIVTSGFEHPSVTAPLAELEKRGFKVVRLSPVNGGDFESKIITNVCEHTVMVSVAAVHNETGFITDTVRIYNEVKRRFPTCIVHTDAAQGFMKVPFNADLISISAHKIHGLKGAGGLYAKKSVRLHPLIHGGGQQNGVRSGTEPTELIAAFGTAVRLYTYEHGFFTQLSDEVTKLLSETDGVIINSRNNIPSIINISVRGIKSEILLHYLAENNIYVSSGSACARGKKSKSLLAFMQSPEDADSALRLSFSHENTADEIRQFIKILQTAIKRFRR